MGASLLLAHRHSSLDPPAKTGYCRETGHTPVTADPRYIQSRAQFVKSQPAARDLVKRGTNRATQRLERGLLGRRGQGPLRLLIMAFSSGRAHPYCRAHHGQSRPGVQADSGCRQHQGRFPPGRDSRRCSHPVPGPFQRAPGAFNGSTQTGIWSRLSRICGSPSGRVSGRPGHGSAMESNAWHAGAEITFSVVGGHNDLLGKIMAATWRPGSNNAAGALVWKRAVCRCSIQW